MIEQNIFSWNQTQKNVKSFLSTNEVNYITILQDCNISSFFNFFKTTEIFIACKGSTSIPWISASCERRWVVMVCYPVHRPGQVRLHTWLNPSTDATTSRSLHFGPLRSTPTSPGFSRFYLDRLLYITHCLYRVQYRNTIRVDNKTFL